MCKTKTKQLKHMSRLHVHKLLMAHNKKFDKMAKKQAIKDIKANSGNPILFD